jgi:2-polyprenyl-3-methyl-5-hydroxy-6-metoxy-1,4-benzoquinol methylase/glycosyltransferase involved in cell wall biosynthesis
MMVKNEEKNLDRCLKSLKPIMEQIDAEIIIVDTGSEDGTVEIARKYTDRVYFHKWNNNFSEMRNITIGYATGKWVFILDADEEVADAEEIIVFFKSEYPDHFNTCTVKVKSLVYNNSDDFVLLVSHRLFKNDGTFGYKGAIHNLPVYKYPVLALNTSIIHYGYISDDEELMERKFERTGSLLKSELEKDPENIYYNFQLSVTYAMHKDYKEALEQAEKAYNLLLKRDEAERKLHIYVYSQLATAYLYFDDFESFCKAKEACQKGIELEKEYIDLYYFLAKIEVNLGNPAEAARIYEKYLELVKNYDSLAIRLNPSVQLQTLCRVEEVFHDLGILYYKQKKFNSAAEYLNQLTSEKHIKDAMEFIAGSYAKIEDYRGLKNFYREKVYDLDKDTVKLFYEYLEININSLEKEKQIPVMSLFAGDKDTYSFLNRIRVSFWSSSGEELGPVIDKFAGQLDLNKQPDYFGDLIYFKLKMKNPLEPLLAHVSESNINRFFNYLTRKYEDFISSVVEYLQGDFNSGGLSGIKVQKALQSYALLFGNMDDGDYLRLFRKYIGTSIKSIRGIYSENVIRNEMVYEVKSLEDAFILLMLRAEEIKSSDSLGYVRYLRKALDIYPYMKKGIELLMNEFKEQNGQENADFESYKAQVKENIGRLINEGQLEAAGALIQEYESIVKKDAEVYSMKAVMAFMEGRPEDAEKIIHSGLEIDGTSFDLLYNLGYIYEQSGRFDSALHAYKKARESCKDKDIMENIDSKIEKIQREHKEAIKEERLKLAFFVKQGMDSFLNDIIAGLSEEYETRKIVVTEYPQIDKGMEWADICWFEWCDELVIYGSKLEIAKRKRLICRLHRYEVFSGFPKNVAWENVDKLIIVASHLKRFLVSSIPDIEKQVSIETVENGVDLEKYNFKERTKGFNLAYVGYIHSRKNPVLLLQIINQLVKRDKRYKLYIAGQFQEPLIEVYWNYQIKQMGLENNVIFEGWKEYISNWLENKNYILSTSIHESFGYGIAEAMAKGIKPVIHNFIFAGEIWDKRYLFNTIDEAVGMIEEKSYHSMEYRKFIEENYSLAKQLKTINKMIDELAVKDKKIRGFNYKDYWNQRLNSKFNIEGVGYIGLGEIYNQFLYQNRIDIVEGVINKAFDGLSNKKVLELGPGIGIFTEYFHNKGVKEYHAIDIAEKSVVELSRKYKDYHFKQGDVSDSYNYEGTYDLIFAADVLLHITDEDNYEKTIKNISEHLEENGICILLDPVSVIHTKSKSPHVVIRDKEQIKKVLENNRLELIEMLPTAYFMNYPFDSEAVGRKGSLAVAIFNLIGQIFSDNSISHDEKRLMGEYLSYKDKQLLYQNNFGLSEKLLIVQKKGRQRGIHFDLKDLLDIDKIRDGIGAISENLNQSNMACRSLLHKINELLNQLEEDGSASLEYIQKKMNEFIAYSHYDFDDYDFSTAQVAIGRREKVTDNYEVIEFILNNNQNSKLIFNNIWYDISDNKFILPDPMQKSKNSEYIINLAKKILGYKLEFVNNIAGFIFDQSIIEDIRKNSLAYVWERGIPASQYMPLLGYLRIVERYTFAAGFMDKSHKVLEAPCGFGYGAAYFSKICKQVEALDIEKDNIVFAKEAYRHENINWVNGDVTKLPYNDNEFDIYVSYEVFEHLPVDIAVKHIEEGYRVIKKSGKFIISTPNRETRKHMNNPFHIKEYGFNELQEIVKRYFNNVKFYSISNFKVEQGMKETAYDMIAVCEK